MQDKYIFLLRFHRIGMVKRAERKECNCKQLGSELKRFNTCKMTVYLTFLYAKKSINVNFL